MNSRARQWRWVLGSIDRNEDHFELRYGSAIPDGWEDWLPVALGGPPSGHVFVVQFLIDATNSLHATALEAARRELDFYLVELGETDPWLYAQYHAGTSSNVYSKVHWSFFLGRQMRLPIQPE